MDNFIVNEDERRCLTEWVSDATIRSLKSIVMKQDGTVGNHYHKLKDEIFFLLAGFARHVVIGSEEYSEIKSPYKWTVPRGTYHSFELTEGSILLSAASLPFDPGDDYV